MITGRKTDYLREARQINNCICICKLIYIFCKEQMKFDGFDWDSGNRAKCQKHGVSIAEIESLFLGTQLVAPDTLHSSKEQRFRAVGRTINQRHLFIVFTLRKNSGTLLIRPISARYMHTKEIQAHEKEIP